MDGILNIYKPLGPTSHDIVSKVRRITGERRIGHAGTLDPDASGVLILCLGQATRIVEYLMDWHKKYRAVAVFGSETDTEDASGNVINRQDCSYLAQEDIEAVIPRFTGEIMQVPPMVSAVHHQGKRLYELAREGKTVERTPRPVTIYNLELIEFRKNACVEAVIDIECSRGTYIRTLCADIGKVVGCGAHMGSLERTAVGCLDIGSAVTLERLEEYIRDDRMGDILRSVNSVLSEMPFIDVSDDDAKRVVNGVKLKIEDLDKSIADMPGIDVPIRIVGPGNHLLAIGRIVEDINGNTVLKPDKVFSGC